MEIEKKIIGQENKAQAEQPFLVVRKTVQCDFVGGCIVMNKLYPFKPLLGHLV